MVRIIGDVHGKTRRYREIIETCRYSIQVGDFGFSTEWNWLRDNVSADKHIVIPGNHDDYTSLSEHALPKFGNYTHGEMEFFYVRGAHSIDKAYRTPGVSWWEDEELSYPELFDAVDAYIKQEPSIVLSHDCPLFLYREFFGIDSSGNRTSIALDNMYEACKSSRIWIFGHHHRLMWDMIKDTLFVCLGELDSISYFPDMTIDQNISSITEQLQSKLISMR